MGWNLEDNLQVDLDGWKEAGLGDAAFRELDNLPGIPLAEAKPPSAGELAAAGYPKPVRPMPPMAKWEKTVAAWPQGKDFDQPSGIPLLREVRFLRTEERTLVHKAGIIKQFSQSRERIQSLFDAIILGDLNQPQGLAEITENLMGLLVSDPYATLALTLMRSNTLSDYQYRHAANTCILTMATAIASGFSRQQVLDMGLGGLLADIGMLLVPEEILNKAGKLTPEELAEIHQHVQHGADLLERLPGLSPMALTVVLQHHERLSGSGYPRHLKGEAISHAARVVAIADTLAAMVHKRSHREAMLAQEALDRVIKMGRMQFLDSPYIRYLAGWLSAYPVGVGVLLQSGRIGRVVAANLEDFNRPWVAVLKGAGGQALPLKQITHIDLHALPDEGIVRCLDDNEAGFKGLEGF